MMQSEDSEEYIDNPVIAPAENEPVVTLSYAPLSKRITAYFIDIIPIAAVVFAVYYFCFGFEDTLNAYIADRDNIELRKAFLSERNHIRYTSFTLWMAYCTLMDNSAIQGTWGKWLMKIKVVDTNGHRLTPLTSSTRNGLKILSFIVLYLGFVWALFDQKKQCWHDKIAKTYVVTK